MIGDKGCMLKSRFFAQNNHCMNSPIINALSYKPV